MLGGLGSGGMDPLFRCGWLGPLQGRVSGSLQRPGLAWLPVGRGPCMCRYNTPLLRLRTPPHHPTQQADGLLVGGGELK